jgi:type II secretion system protein I
MIRSRRHPLAPQRRRARRGFTLIEVLFTLMLLGIIIPSAMRVVGMSRTASKLAQHRTEAAGLAESKLTELAAGGQWQNMALSGDFVAEGWEGYTWQAEVVNWDQAENMQELRVTVIWIDSDRGQEFVSVDTLVYLSNAAAQSSSGSDFGGTTGGTVP